MREREEVSVRVVEEWLSTNYAYTIATYTWQHAPPRVPTVKYFVLVTNGLTRKVTLIHSSLCVGGIYMDINVDSSR